MSECVVSDTAPVRDTARTVAPVGESPVRATATGASDAPVTPSASRTLLDDPGQRRASLSTWPFAARRCHFEPQVDAPLWHESGTPGAGNAATWIPSPTRSRSACPVPGTKEVAPSPGPLSTLGVGTSNWPETGTGNWPLTGRSGSAMMAAPSRSRHPTSLVLGSHASARGCMVVRAGRAQRVDWFRTRRMNSRRPLTPVLIGAGLIVFSMLARSWRLAHSSVDSPDSDERHQPASQRHHRNDEVGPATQPEPGPGRHRHRPVGQRRARCWEDNRQQKVGRTY